MHLRLSYNEVTARWLCLHRRAGWRVSVFLPRGVLAMCALQIAAPPSRGLARDHRFNFRRTTLPGMDRALARKNL